ncbi:MAG TPA: hypothetical protein PKE69_11980 [Pyrinomonadaceae bacterium]|nr:hypothetical protein [Pyrinomonadaceae bacterium]
MNRKLLLSLLLILLVQTVFSQTTDAAKTEKDAELKKQAVEFLRETGLEVKNLQTLENRISFSAEIAGLMWFHDEKEARTMYQTTIADFRQLLTELNQQYTTLDASEKTEEVYDDFLFGEATTKSKVLRKLEKAMGVRQQIALSIAEHDAETGYEFFNSTSQIVTNAELSQRISYRDTYTELKLLDFMAEQDIDKAIEAARKMISKGKAFEVLGLVKKIYDKDDKKGSALGEEVISKMKFDSINPSNQYYFSAILNMGIENLEKIKDTPDKKPLFSRESLRDVADLLGQQILKLDPKEFADAERYAVLIEKFSPARAQQIRLKFKEPKKNEGDSVRNTVIAEETDSVSVRRNESTEQQKQITEEVKKLQNKDLPKEDREKVVAKMREILSKVKSREQKIIGLSLLASQVAAFGDKDLANEIMTEARNLVTTSPKNYKEYLSVWMLASGYTQVDTDKAFPLLEDTIFRLNETIAAFIKVAEFIDVNAEIIEDGEIQVGSFGGELTRGLLSELGAANQPLLTLAKADFGRTKGLTNKFDRLEVRILAKMLIIRAVFGEKKIVEKSS